MEAVQTFAIQPHEGTSGDSRLLAEGTAIGRVEGLVLEAQFRCGPGYLVVTSDGNPFEEGLHFYLLDTSYAVLDDVSLGRMYHAGMYRNVIVGPDRDALEFEFFGNDRWRLSIASQPRRTWFRRPFSAVTRTRKWLAPHRLDLRKVEHQSRAAP